MNMIKMEHQNVSPNVVQNVEGRRYVSTGKYTLLISAVKKYLLYIWLTQYTIRVHLTQLYEFFLE